MLILTTRRKHKRGERGSIEQDQSSSKRANMASKNNDHVEEESEEPSRLELKEMLVGIKIDVSNILRENAKLTKELVELRSLIKEQKDEIDAMKVSIKKSKDQNLALENELVAARKKTDDEQGEIAELYCLQDNLEQCTKKQSLKNWGISDILYSSTEEAVMKIAEVLEVPMSPEDINTSHKIKSKGAGSILVKFQNHKAKSRLYKARTKLKNIRVTDIYPNTSTATRVMVCQGPILTTYSSRESGDSTRTSRTSRKTMVTIGSICSSRDVVFFSEIK